MGQLHVFFFPVMAHGHMIPTLDIAKLFAARGIKSTIITTPLNANCFAKSVDKTKNLGLRIIKFPAAEAGLPEGCENIDQLPSDDMIPNFFRATTMLEDQLEQVLEECRPSCLVADMFFPWATDLAAKFGIPRLVFHGTSFFALCASLTLVLHKPQRNVSSDDEPFVFPNLPHEIKFTRLQLSVYDRQDTENYFTRMLNRIRESDKFSSGVIVNSFYELEPDYADHYRTVLGIKAWHIGPVSLCNREIEDKANRGKKSSINEQECLKWLDSKKPNSVIYVSFGSTANFHTSQLREIALGLEASGQQFIWVVRRGKKEEEEEENQKWLPEGFEERTKDKGLIIRGWAPQVLILEHEAVGGFVTHCGWNSTLEGVSAGVPMVTWPVFAEQFYNEKLVTEILKLGVGVGVVQWSSGTATGGIQSEAIAKAVRRIMVGEEAKELRNRAKGYKEMAKKAVEEGGSSHSDLNALIQELSSHCA